MEEINIENGFKVKNYSKNLQTGQGNWKGSKLFPNPYFNLFICAKKQSGKTNLLFNILKETSDKNTHLIIFSSTVHKDPLWHEIVKYFENKGQPIVTHTTIKDGAFEEVMDILNTPVEDSDDEDTGTGTGPEDEEEPPKKLIILNETDKKPKRKSKKKKPIPNYTIVMDDLSAETRDKRIPVLLKKNRHYKCRICILSQYIQDLDPQSLKQLDYWILLPGHSEDKMRLVYKHADISNPQFEEFYDIYKEVTAEPYNFLYISSSNDELRHNFNKKIKLL